MGLALVDHLAEIRGTKECGSEVKLPDYLTKKEIEKWLKGSEKFPRDKFHNGFAHLFSDDLDDYRYNIGIREATGKYTAAHSIKPPICMLQEFAVNYARAIAKWLAILFGILAVISTPFLIAYYYYLRRKKIANIKRMIEDHTIFEPLSGLTLHELEDIWTGQGYRGSELDGLCDEMLKKEGSIQKGVDPFRGGSAFFFSMNAEGSQRRQAAASTPQAATPAPHDFKTPATGYGSGIDFFRQAHT